MQHPTLLLYSPFHLLYHFTLLLLHHSPFHLLYHFTLLLLHHSPFHLLYHFTLLLLHHSPFHPSLSFYTPAASSFTLPLHRSAFLRRLPSYFIFTFHPITILCPSPNHPSSSITLPSLFVSHPPTLLHHSPAYFTVTIHLP